LKKLKGQKLRPEEELEEGESCEKGKKKKTQVGFEMKFTFSSAQIGPR